MSRAPVLAALALALGLAAPAGADVRDGCTAAVHPLATYAECSFPADAPIRWISHGNADWAIHVVRGEYVEAYVFGGRDGIGSVPYPQPGDVVRVTIWLPEPGAGVIDVREE